MPEIENRVEKNAEKKEYTAAEGIDKAVNDIESLLRSKDYVAVTVTGSNIDVGKTFISTGIIRGLYSRGFSIYAATDIDSLSIKPCFLESPKKGHVIVFRAEYEVLLPGEEGKKMQDYQLEKKMQEFGLPISKVDLRVYVYRPDKPFSETADLNHADILIRNEGAKDKPRQ